MIVFMSFDINIQWEPPLPSADPCLIHQDLCMLCQRRSIRVPFETYSGYKPYAVGQVYEVSFSGPIYDLRDLKTSHLGLCGSKTIRDVHKLSFFRHLTGWMIFQLPFLDRKEAPFFKYT